MAETIILTSNAGNFFTPFIDVSRTEVIMIWKAVTGYEGLYEVSNYGEIRSVDKLVHIGFGRKQFRKGRILPTPVSRNKYRTIRFSKNGDYQDYLVHRVVAIHFKSNPLNKPIVNHKNGNKLDCAAWNLEWSTYSHNNKHAYDTGLKTGAFKGVFGADHPISKPLLQLDIIGNVIKEWVSPAVAGRELGIRCRGIRSVCAGVDNTYKGFIWKYK